MRRLFLSVLVGVSVSTLHGQGRSTDSGRLVAALDSNRMRAHLSALAHDSMEGRGPGTPGGLRAGNYIARQFREIGLIPGGDSGTYFHHFQYQTTRNIRSAVRVNGHSLSYGVDQLVTTNGNVQEVTARGEAVFVGYGISAPGWDDYKGTSVEGKIVIVLAGIPKGADPGAIPSNAATRSSKARAAAAHGALITLLIHRDDLAGFSWNVIQRFWRGEHVVNPSTGSTGMQERTSASGFLGTRAGERVLQAGGYSLDRAVALANARPTGVIDLPLPIAVEATNRVWTTRARNVVGRMEGSGPSAGEFVVIGGHYDAYGIGPAINGDSIYNGAEDNAAGIAQVLGLAEGFIRSGVRPRRSFLFVGFDAEEPGLLGAEAFVARPPVPVSSQVAMINLDAVNLYGATRDAAALGLKESTLNESFRRAAVAEGMVVPSAQPDSIEAFFLRSDQLPFARAGVPAIFVFVGWDFVGRTPEWASRMWSNYFEQHYHQPSDAMQDYFSMAGALQQARVVARTALEIANTAERPEWVPGSTYRQK
jgi:Peptidase family M28